MIHDYAKRCEKSMMLSSLITIILGVVLTMDPGSSIRAITTIIAVLFMAIGAFQLFIYLKSPKEEKIYSMSFIIGIILIVIGIFLFVNKESLSNFITIIIGITIILKSLFKIQFAINVKDLSNKWKYNLIGGLLSLVLGIVIIAYPSSTAELFLRIVGIIFIIGSVVEICETYLVYKTLDDVKEINNIIEGDVTDEEE